MWSKWSKGSFAISRILLAGEINERGFSNPHPWSSHLCSWVIHKSKHSRLLRLTGGKIVSANQVDVSKYDKIWYNTNIILHDILPWSRKICIDYDSRTKISVCLDNTLAGVRATFQSKRTIPTANLVASTLPSRSHENSPVNKIGSCHK